MKLVRRWPVALTSLLLVLGLCHLGRATVSEHLFGGQIVQSQVYNDPNQTAPLYIFTFQAETDANVASIDFVTAAGHTYTIPADEQTTSEEIDTYHWVKGTTHVWEYWGYFEDPNALHNYGDGSYKAVLHYSDGAKEQTTIWYGVPDTNQPIPAPTQKPNVLWPRHADLVASPVIFEWDPIIDPNVADIYLSVINDSNDYIINDVYDMNALSSEPYDMNEGRYEVEFAIETFYAITNADGIPFHVLKSSTMLQPFEVVATSVYRFWSPTTDRHFYTINSAEKDKLINKYSQTWTFEGTVFYAWATPYDPNLVPVYRFWSDRSSSHFYTISEGEKNKLIAKYSDVWTYEGIAFYAYAPGRQPADVNPVYRFWKPSDGTHFYTISEDEKNKLIDRYSNIYTFEGIAFYAWQ